MTPDTIRARRIELHHQIDEAMKALREATKEILHLYATCQHTRIGAFTDQLRICNDCGKIQNVGASERNGEEH